MMGWGGRVGSAGLACAGCSIPNWVGFASEKSKNATSSLRLRALSSISRAAAAASSTIAAFCCVTLSISMMAALTCSMPSLCSRVALSIYLTNAAVCSVSFMISARN